VITRRPINQSAGILTRMDLTRPNILAFGSSVCRTIAPALLTISMVAGTNAA
jgi:hypothetical protein